MRFLPTFIAQLFTVDLEPRCDHRGYLTRIWCRDELAARGLADRCVQANLVYNARRGTLRGMHYQSPPHAEAKVVRVLRGAVHDVVLDLRAGSPTFGRWFACELSADNRRGLFIPEGCAHGYLSLTEETELLYLHSAAYHPAHAAGVRWDCDALQSAWPFTPQVISSQDEQWPSQLPQVAAVCRS